MEGKGSAVSLTKQIGNNLCIPATSAASERVFSSSDLTIAKEQLHLDPSSANELLFLHETLLAMIFYKVSIDAEH